MAEQIEDEKSEHLEEQPEVETENEKDTKPLKNGAGNLHFNFSLGGNLNFTLIGGGVVAFVVIELIQKYFL